LALSGNLSGGKLTGGKLSGERRDHIKRLISA
jgi:hypothetical protein